MRTRARARNRYARPVVVRVKKPVRETAVPAVYCPKKKQRTDTERREREKKK